MKKNLFAFNTKYLKTGGYSVLVSCVAIAIIIFLNLFVNKLPASVTKLDMSSTDIYSINEKTETVVKGIKEEIKVYYVAQHGQENSMITTMFERYKTLNGKLKFEQIDPAINPGFLSGDRAEAYDGCIVVESAKRSKIIDPISIFYPGVSIDQINQYYQQYQTTPSSTGFDLENCLTSALNYVTTDQLPVVYALQGHGELALTDEYAGYLEAESIEIKELNLVTLEAVPEDCDCLFINVPMKDISSDEAERILTYLKAGGKLMFTSYFEYNMTTEQKNLDSVLAYYGLEKVDGIVFEGDSNAHYPQMPYIILPSYSDHEITAPLKDYAIITAYTQGIKVSDDVRESVEITPLLSTTDKAYSKTNLDSKVSTKEDSDISGPFDIAVAATEKNEDGTETKIVWINTPSLVDSSLDFTGASTAMFVNSFGWMCEMEDSISVPVKSYEQSALQISESQSNLLMWIFTIIIPVAVIAVGGVVWYRRRSR